MSLYKNKYRIEATRLKGWDYRWPGLYFTTICTKHRIHYFGECRNGEMNMNEVGRIVQGCWEEIPYHFNYVTLGDFVVMPNHMHGVLGLDNAVETLQCNVSTHLTTGANESKSGISPKPGSVSTIIRSFKSACTKNINRLHPNLNFRWQERFHDHIIRNEEEFYAISNYIINNPANWMTDEFYQA